MVAAKLTGQEVWPQDELDVSALLQAAVVLDPSRVKDLVAFRPGRFAVFEEIRSLVLGG